jgi:hypothetical protein
MVDPYELNCPAGAPKLKDVHRRKRAKRVEAGRKGVVTVRRVLEQQAERRRPTQVIDEPRS